MEQVSCIALAVLAYAIATVNAAVGDDALGRNNVARGERRPKPVNDLGGGVNRRQARPLGRRPG